MFLNQPPQKPPKEEMINIDVNKDIKPQMEKVPEPLLKQLMVQANNWADYQKYTRLMNNIAEEMRIIPHLPSEVAKPDDTSPLLKVEFPDQGGVLTWMEHYDYPYKGYPHFEFVEKIDHLKKLNRAFLSGAYHQMKAYNKLKLVTLIPAVWVVKNFVRVWIHTFYRFVERFIIKEKRYCDSIREIHRTFSLPIKNESAKDAELRGMIRDLFCMVVEFDNAYRFRLQDIFAELNWDALRNKPIKELVRLLDIASSREKKQEVKDTWKLAKYFLKYYLRFDKKLLKIIQSALLQADSKKMALSIEDKAYCAPRTDYVFGFMLKPDKNDKTVLEMNQLTEEYKQETKKIKTESTSEHESNPTKLQELDDKYNEKLKGLYESYRAKKTKLLETITI